MSHTPQDRANGIIFDAAREAGFEDGFDFKVAEGPASCSPRMKEWLKRHQSELMLKAWQAWTAGGEA